MSTSFDTYLAGHPSLSSAGHPPTGGRTTATTKNLLETDLKGHFINESAIKIQDTDSISHILLSDKFSLTEEIIKSISLYPNKKNSPPAYFHGSWNLYGKNMPKRRNVGTSSSIMINARNSSEPGTTSEDFGPSDDDEYTMNSGSKRKREVAPSTEKRLEQLCRAMIYFFYKQAKHTSSGIPQNSEPVKRYWTASFSISPIPDLYNSQKPDLALFDYEKKTLPKTWVDVLSFIEHTASDFAQRRDIAMYWGSTIKAYLIMREQPWRRFVISFSISADCIRTHYLDRSGLIMSLPVNIHSSPALFIKAIGTVSLADQEALGFDDTIHMCVPHCKGSHATLADGAIGWVKNNSGKTYSIMDVLFKSQGLFCRGTVCYRVRDHDDKIDYAMKDCWVAETKRYHEVDVLNRVKGIPNVVALVDHWDVKYRGQDDCTDLIRRRYGMSPKERGDENFCNRYHRRLIMKPCGEPLSQFATRKELICAFRDFVIGEFGFNVLNRG